MPNIADQTYLREQYKNAANLNDRIQLHVRFSTNRLRFPHVGLRSAEARSG